MKLTAYLDSEGSLQGGQARSQPPKRAESKPQFACHIACGSHIWNSITGLSIGNPRPPTDLFRRPDRSGGLHSAKFSPDRKINILTFSICVPASEFVNLRDLGHPTQNRDCRQSTDLFQRTGRNRDIDQTKILTDEKINFRNIYIETWSRALI